jgi:hypothetical protein
MLCSVPFARCLALVAVCFTLFALPACKPKPEAQVVTHYEAGEENIRNNNAGALVARLTDESLAFYKECLSLAQSCPEKELRKKEPYKLATILKMRNRIDPKRLRMMTVDDYFAWRIENSDLVVDADYGVYPFRTTVNGDSAVMQMGMEVQRSTTFRIGRRGGGLVRAGIGSALSTRKKLEPIEGYTLHYVKGATGWRDDVIADAKSFDESVRVEANQSGMSVEDYILSIEEDESGGLSEKIWQPPLKIKG